MIGIIVIMIIGVLLILDSIRMWNKDIKRIKELEKRLQEYYKEREKTLKLRLKSKGLIRRGHEWPE
jgi:uncharacterized membrane protein (DUF106 family)